MEWFFVPKNYKLFGNVGQDDTVSIPLNTVLDTGTRLIYSLQKYWSRMPLLHLSNTESKSLGSV